MPRVSTGRLVALGGSCIVVGACGSPPCDEAEDAGLRGSEGETWCALVEVVEGSEMGGTYRELLLECLEEEADADERDELLEAFQGASDEELEVLLLDRLEECDTWQEYWEDQDVH